MPRSDPSGNNLKTEFPSVRFLDPAGSGEAYSSLHHVFLAAGSRFPPDALDRMISASIVRASDPDLLIRNLLRFTEATVSRASLFNDLIQFTPLAELLCAVLGHSPYFSDILVRDPELFRWLTTAGVLDPGRPSAPAGDEISRIMETFRSPARRLDGLRRAYRREVLKIGARDILGIDDVGRTTGALSGLADLMIHGVVLIAAAGIQEEFPEPPRTPFCVIGLGKLGGNELNYSSDVDLMFVYGEEITVKAGRLEYTSHQYFVRLAEQIAQKLSQSSAEGHLYRVDTRLRPEGAAGPLARSVQAYLDYYESRGEIWERQMLVKARAVAGDRAFGDRFLEQLTPFVYPRTQFLNPVESVSRIKARIESRTSADNVKLREGGIRDIEFAVQALQLLHGGKRPEVRTGNTLESIGRLAGAGLLSADEADRLRTAYELYRNVEHRLQIALNTQTHTVPREGPQREVLAAGLGYANGEELQNALDRSFRAVRVIFDDVLAAGKETETGLGLIAGEEGLPAEDLIAPYGFIDKKKALRHLRMLMTGSGLSGPRLLDRRQSEAFRAIGGTILREISETPRPDMTLSNLTTISSAQRFPGQFYKQLQESGFRNMILKICSISPALVKSATRYPQVIERIGAGIGPEKEEIPLRKPGVATVKNRRETFIGLQHLLGMTTFEEMTEALSGLADSVVAAVGSRVVKQRRLRALPLALFGLGKYGTRELGFGSDLDLLFVSGTGQGVRRPALERFAQELVQGLSEVSGEGLLYDVDARLRPEGRNAPLVSDTGRFSEYLSGRASLWERQSMTRLRFVWGDGRVGRQVLDRVRKAVYDAPLPDNWVETILSMREKMETRSRFSRSAFHDIKLGPGGMVDVEFTAQMIQLSAGREIAPLRQVLPASSILSQAPDDILGQGEADRLARHYRFLREIEKLLRWTLEERGSVLPDGERLDLLARCAGRKDGEQLRLSVDTSMQEVRSLFLMTAERIRSRRA